MRRIKGYPFVLFLLVIVLLFNVFNKVGEKTRVAMIGWVSPAWEACLAVKESAFSQSELKKAQAQIADLSRENAFLIEQVENIKQWLLQQDRIDEDLVRVKTLSHTEGADWKNYFIRRQKQLSRILELQMKALPAKVIYREPSYWSSYVWINLGEKQNRALGEAVIAKNSPVVVGHTLVGIVEEVHEHKSKVRLITDSRLIPAVRALRGQSQSCVLDKCIEEVIHILQNRQELFSSEKEASEFFAFLGRLKQKGKEKGSDVYLAKGELCGASLPLWRARGQMLRGTGFNYDFADEEGLPRDLRTGKPSLGPDKEAVALLQEGDILVTSGLDGIFPAGLQVAVVSVIESLQEGECSYRIYAKPLASDLDELKFVFVLPPLAG